MKNTVGFLIVLTFLHCACAAIADAPASYFRLQSRLFVSVNGQYIAPNEEYPQRLIPFWQTAPPGAYVSVGTERGFMGAANSPNTTDLILIDSDKKVVAYNQVNTLLLRIARNRDHYLDLRMRPSHESWLDAINSAGLDQADGDYLLHQMASWRKYVAKNSRFKRFHAGPSLEQRKFGEANYLYNDRAFAKIQHLAKAGCIKVLHLDLSKTNEVRELTTAMRHENIPLSVLDLSNAWWSMYIRRSSLKVDLNYFNEIASAQTRLIISAYRWMGFFLDIAIERTSCPFQYLLYTFGHIRKFDSSRKFIKSIRRDRYKLTRSPLLREGGPQRSSCMNVLIGRMKQRAWHLSD